ncbi:hypothetical protein HY379_02330, partial [Candidatus Saccharibacteria bacterium]|nr:hypothetical protein [Candidatus Saccharibacteria bacterium]
MATETFIHPSGFIEQSYKGTQTAKSVQEGIGQLRKCATKLKKQKKPLLVLIDISELKGTNAEARKAGLEGIKTVHFKKAAIYGPLWTQVLVNSLALIAGQKNKVKAFDNRVEAVGW